VDKSLDAEVRRVRRSFESISRCHHSLRLVHVLPVEHGGCATLSYGGGRWLESTRRDHFDHVFSTMMLGILTSFNGRTLVCGPGNATGSIPPVRTMPV
jgi:hypothetical protein